MLAEDAILQVACSCCKSVFPVVADELRSIFSGDATGNDRECGCGKLCYGHARGVVNTFSDSYSPIVKVWKSS